MEFISDAQVAAHCSMNDTLNLMMEAFGFLSSDQATVPLRTHLHVSESVRSLIMPVAVSQVSTFGLKAVSLADNNEKRGLPRIHGSILLFDGQTGEPVCVLEAEYITSLRTGAAVGLATEVEWEALTDTGGGQAVRVEGVMLPLLDLRRILGPGSRIEASDTLRIVVVEQGQRRAAMVVDVVT